MKNHKLNKSLEDYITILEYIQELPTRHEFNSFDKCIKIEDCVVKPFDTLYYLLSDLKEIENDHKIIDSLFGFETQLHKGRIVTLIHRAIDLGANMSEFSLEDFYRLLDLKDKDIYIALSKSRYITKEVATKLASSLDKDITYLAYHNLFENPHLQKVFKKELIDICKQKIDDNPKDYTLLDSLVKQYKRRF